jgi:heptosyltransferase-3
MLPLMSWAILWVNPGEVIEKRGLVIWTFPILIQEIHEVGVLIRRLLIRPGAIGDFIVSLPAMESLRADYTEVWCAEQNVALARFADRAQSIGRSGLDRLGLLPGEDVVERLRGFDSIVSWYGGAREEFERLGLPAVILPALPGAGRHAVEFYNEQARGLGGAPGRFPSITCPRVRREFAAIHPFASGERKRGPMEWFEAAARRLGERIPVRWVCGPEDELAGAVRIADLYELACWLRGARVLVGNDSGIAHLAAAVGTPVVSLFPARSGADARVWAARGDAVLVQRGFTGVQAGQKPCPTNC